MVTLAFSLARVFGALFLVVLNGFFVASEFAFVRVRSTSVEQLAEEGRAGSAALSDVMDNLDDYLAATQLGITIASLGLGWIGEPAVAALIEPVLESVLPASIIHLVAFAIGFGTITFLHVVFGELAPKTIAIADAKKVSLFLAPPMKASYYILYPGIVVFNGAANAFTRMLGVPPASETDETMKEREIRRVLARSGDAGHVGTTEVEMIERVFDLNDTVVREVMVPRPDVVSVPADMSLSELRETVLEAGHTRYPVVEADDADSVVGFVDAKDVLRAMDSGTASTTAGDLARDLVVVPETTAIDDLLLQFRDDQRQMAAVIDEWGSFEGIATVEDVVEAIVGDLRDGFDADDRQHSIRKRDDDTYDADGSVALSVVNEELGTDLTSDGFDTLGGYVLDRLNRAPETGDTVQADGFVVEVRSVDGARVSRLRIRRADDAEGEDGADDPGASDDPDASEN